jgi:hypothetical protein
MSSKLRLGDIITDFVLIKSYIDSILPLVDWKWGQYLRVGRSVYRGLKSQ